MGPDPGLETDSRPYRSSLHDSSIFLGRKYELTGWQNILLALFEMGNRARLVKK